MAAARACPSCCIRTVCHPCEANAGISVGFTPSASITSAISPPQMILLFLVCCAASKLTGPSLFSLSVEEGEASDFSLAWDSSVTASGNCPRAWVDAERLGALGDWLRTSKSHSVAYGDHVLRGTFLSPVQSTSCSTIFLSVPYGQENLLHRDTNMPRCSRDHSAFSWAHSDGSRRPATGVSVHSCSLIA